MINKWPILKEPLVKVGLNVEFCIQAREMGFNTLEDILILLPEDLIDRRGFSYSWLAELAAFLNAKGILHLLQPLPGSNAG